MQCKELNFAKDPAMKPLVVNSAMTSMNGVFYPTGHVFALFQDEGALQQAVAELQKGGHQGSLAYASPEGIRNEITRTVDDTETTLPSVGADNDLVRRIDNLARRGHHGVLIEVTDKDAVENVQAALTEHQATAAFYYRTFIIEELVKPPPTPNDPSVLVGTRAPGSHPKP